MKSRSLWQSNTGLGGNSILKDNQRRKISTTIRFLKADLNELGQLFTGANDISEVVKVLVEITRVVPIFSLRCQPVY